MKNQAFSAYSRDTAETASLPIRISGNRFCGGYDAAIRHPGGNRPKNNCRACLDRAWLDYQRETASRHKPAIKTNKVVAAADHLPLRYMIAKIYQIAAPIKPFLSREGHCANEAKTLRQAWSKAIFWPMALRGGPQGTYDFN